ncbi:MAG: CopD family protein [Candidatus Schekmanbacteria bacterium]|nr:CopD family protein [Candidatus Schekmanbacteria bacterium]
MAVHIVTVCLWLGGMGFLALVVVPVTRRPALRSLAPRLVLETGMRFRSVGWTCLAVLLITGAFNLYCRGFGATELLSPWFWRTDFGFALLLKLALFAFVLALSAVHDFAIGPRASALLIADPESAAALRYRRTAGWMGRLNALLALAIVWLAVVLVRGWP